MFLSNVVYLDQLLTFYSPEYLHNFRNTNKIQKQGLSQQNTVELCEKEKKLWGLHKGKRTFRFT